MTFLLTRKVIFLFISIIKYDIMHMVIKMKVDLHNHSTFSDGLYTPKELLQIAKNNGVDVFALTDHDSVFGCDIIQKWAEDANIKVISGMELSTEYKGKSVHIVCLFKNNIVPQSLIEFSYQKKEERKKRAIQMMENIKNIYGLKIDMKALFEDSEVITRANMLYNIAKCNHLTHQEAEPYISNESKAYIPSTKLSTKEGITLAKQCDCTTILAHPCLLPRSYVEEIVQMGVDGIEIRYPKNQGDDEAYFSHLADQYHLLKSAGSDFHGDAGTKHAMMGTSTLNEEEFEPIRKRLGKLWK